MAQNKRKKMSLGEWITETGVDEVAALLDVDGSTVRHWRTGHVYPRVKQMKEIKRLSRGRVGYEQIIDYVPTSWFQRSEAGQ